MRLVIFILAVTGLLAACEQKATSSSQSVVKDPGQLAEEKALSESERLNRWFDKKFAEELSHSPIWTTQLGRKDNYDQIDDLSEQAEIELLKWREESVAELKAIFDYEALSADARVSYDVWVYQYENARALAPYRRNRYVFTQMQGEQSMLPNFLINYHRVDDESDMWAYIKRISGISRAINQLLERAKVAAAEGVRPPRFAYDGVIEEASNQLQGEPFVSKSNKDAPLWSDAKAKIEALKKAEKIDEVKAGELNAAAKKTLLENFQPAYKELIGWFADDIENTSATAQGVGALPNGEAFYNLTLASRTTVNLTADEIHNIGLAEVARILEEMEAIKQQVGFEGSLKEFFALTKNDRQFFYPDNDDGRTSYINDTNIFLDAIKAKLPQYFGLLPRADLVVKRVEAFREQDGGAAHYSSGTPDGSRPGVYYMHLPNMNFSSLNMESTAYHEGNPGHHMQISIAQELSGVPEFRTQIFFTAYVEGWGLYAEGLAKEIGAFENPYMDFGRLTLEVWRAIRLVVDTGIHSKGWSEERAIQYFQDNSPLGDSKIRSEVRRYIVWPGQATGYKVGMLKILELREKAETELGDKFDIRGFHDTVLGGGALPLSILERQVDSWIGKMKQS
jgi:uncharacterized protein (DUF885 family)